MSTETVPFWPFAGEVDVDPYPAYAVQRASDPVRLVPDEGMYVVTRHSFVRELLRDPRCTAARLASAEEMGQGNAELGAPLARTLSRMAAFSDPPRHEHVRRPVQRAFAPRVVAPMRARFAALAREHVAAVDAACDADGVADVAAALVEPLVNAAVATMLRLPPEAPSVIRELWSRAGISAGGLGSGMTEESPRRLAEIHVYLDSVLRAARAQPGDDPLGVFVREGQADPEVSDPDLVANLIFAMNAGHRDLSQAFGLFLHTLATNPAAWALLRDRPGLVRGAVEALLRHDTSVQFTSRRLAADVDIGGRTLEAGRLAVLMLGAANRDPDAFADPDGLDFEHASAKHVAFGYGPHFCAGAAASRLILQEALAAVVERAPHLELAEPTVWSTFRPNMRGCERLRVRW